MSTTVLTTCGGIVINGYCIKCGQLNNTGFTCIRLIPSQNRNIISNMKGWICPVCGAGVSPYTSVCPCNKFKV